MTTKYHLANIRAFLVEGFSVEELRILCFDFSGFRPVYHQITPEMGRQAIVTKLLEHAEAKLQMETLLALAKEANPALYDAYEPYQVDDPTPALQKQVAELSRQVAQLTAPTSLTAAPNPATRPTMTPKRASESMVRITCQSVAPSDRS